MSDEPEMLPKIGSGSDTSIPTIPFALAAATAAHRFCDDDVELEDTEASLVCAKPAAGTKMKRKPPNFADAQTIVTINVTYREGPSQPFRVHQDFLCYYSPYFEAVFKGKFAESKSGALDLEDVSPKVFEIFVNWLYTQTVFLPGSKLPQIQDLMNLWIFADRLLIPRLQNHTLEAIDRVRLKSKTFPSSVFHHVYEYTDKGSPLRRYIVDVMSRGKANPLQYPERFPVELLVDIINVMRMRVEVGVIKFSEHDLKGYHVSEDVPSRDRKPGVEFEYSK